MPIAAEVEAHLDSVLKRERKHHAKRLDRERVRVEWANQAAEQQVSKAIDEAEASVARARADAFEIMARARERLAKERNRCAKELQAAGERELESSRQCGIRVGQAEAGRAAVVLDIQARLQKAEKLRKDAVAAAEAVARDTEELAEERIADARRRETVADERAARLCFDSEARETRRLREVECRMLKWEEEAKQKWQHTQRVSLERIEQHLSYCRRALCYAEQQWGTSQGRTKDELKRADRQAEEHRGLAEHLTAVGDQCNILAIEAEKQAADMASQVGDEHKHWCARRAHAAAEQLEAAQGREFTEKQMKTFFEDRITTGSRDFANSTKAVSGLAELARQLRAGVID